MSDFLDHVAALSPEKRALLELHIQKKKGEAQAVEQSIPRRAEAQAYPQSFAQEQLWILHQIQPESAFYTTPRGFRLSGPLDITALQKSLDEIARRHEILRTTFNSREGQPVQIIAPLGSLPLTIRDLRQLPPTERENALQQQIKEEVQTPFKLSLGPLVRTTLFKLDVIEHVLLFSIHHSVFDAWSQNIFLRELATLYKAFLSGKPSPLPELPIQYADFACWQRQWLQGAFLEEQLAYWRKKLGGDLPLLQLPSDHPRPATQAFRGERQSFRFVPALAQDLNKLSQQEGVTLFILLLAAFQTLLHRYTDQDDIVVATNVANRPKQELEELIGFFANPVVLRSNLSGNPTFRRFLNSVRETALDAFAHAELPFEKLVEDLQPKRTLRYTPLFQVMFVVQSTKGEELTLQSIHVDPLLIDTGASAFDLTFFIEEQPDGLHGTVQYNTDLFERSTITRLQGHFQNILEAIVAHPEDRLASLPLLTPGERCQILTQWNVQRVPGLSEQPVHRLFEDQVRRTPDAMAIVFEDGQLTYSELNTRANQLAQYLSQYGIGPEIRVGICVERSSELIIGLLGILKAGGTYVPLDPTYPAERLSFILANAQVPVLLTQSILLETLPANQATMICLDRDWPLIARESPNNIQSVQLSPFNLAYIIYTSGSTGQPKGVMIQHQGLTNFVQAAQNVFALDAHHRQFQFVSIGFDVLGEELFPPLCNGASVVLHRSPTEQSATELLFECERLGVSKINMPASYWHFLVDELSSSKRSVPKSLTLLVTGAESPSLEKLFIWQQFVHHELTFLNVYGVTEATILSTLYKVSSQSVRSDAPTKIPIGRPFPNAEVYLLDAQLQPVPVGMSGQIYLGGIGLARGYMQRPDLTAERFIPHPFSAEPGARLYRTGDIARYLPDGNIEFLGRIDHQVKVRGFRIELEEIEAVLKKHPQINEVVVVVREDGPSQSQQLVAYLLPVTENGSFNSSELRHFLQSQLPDYMLPSAFVQLDAWPLSPNGKLDRQALPAPHQSGSGSSNIYSAPRTPLEIALANIWMQVLGVEQVSIYDNFFELGGDSILGIQAVARAKQSHIYLLPKHLFEAETLEELAALVETTSSTAMSAEQNAVYGPVLLTPIQAWLLEQNLPDLHHWNQSILLEMLQEIDPLLLEIAFKQLLIQHDALRLRFEHGENGWQQTNAGPEEEVSIVLIDVSALSEEEQAQTVSARLAELQASLDLTSGPLLRVALFHFGAARADRLLIIIHHLAVDRVSWGILLDDLQTLCRQLLQGGTGLAAKTTSFQTWANHLKIYARSAEIEQERRYWQELTRQSAPLLPTDREVGTHGGNTVASARTVQVTLNAQATHAFLHVLPAIHHTQINEALLMALVQTFAPWTGQPSLLVDLEGHGREDLFDLDLSRTVGWFTTLFPLRLELPPGSLLADPFLYKPVAVLNGQVEQALKAVKEQVRSVPGRGIGYGLLRYLHTADENAGQAQLQSPAQVSFNYLGQMDAMLGNSEFFRLSREARGPMQSPSGHRSHLIDINASIIDSQLQLTWIYSENVHQQATIEKLANRFVAILEGIAAWCQHSTTSGYIPSDFPLAKLDQQTLDAVITRATRRRE